MVRFVKDVVFSFLAIAGIFAPIIVSESSSNASPLSCESIRSADQRHFCRATSIPRKSECEFIKNHDLRQHCRAVVKLDKETSEMERIVFCYELTLFCIVGCAILNFLDSQLSRLFQKSPGSPSNIRKA